jgi:hypothetical protein
MERIFNMLLPDSEVKLKKQYYDKLGNRYTIESGDNGWTILSYDFFDYNNNNLNDSQCNFDIAYNTLKTIVPTIKEF